MLFSWLKTRRRRKLLSEPFPPDWLPLLRDIEHYRRLNENEQTALRERVRLFVAEKEFEGCKGMAITDEMRVTIAALASILVLGLPNCHFDNVQTILVYPKQYRVPKKLPVGGNMFGEPIELNIEAENLGEAHYRGPVHLSWAEVERDARQSGEGFNLVFHEFAHQLDMLNGAADGVPPLPRALRGRWQEVMAREYRALCRAADRGRETLIDPYGAEEPAEFFAVVTECFFDLPMPLRAEHEQLYDLMREYYGQDPASRFE